MSPVLDTRRRTPPHGDPLALDAGLVSWREHAVRIARAFGLKVSSSLSRSAAPSDHWSRSVLLDTVSGGEPDGEVVEYLAGRRSVGSTLELDPLSPLPPPRSRP
jgi:hypothetical protein